jgi:hypothetical protein
VLMREMETEIVRVSGGVGRGCVCVHAAVFTRCEEERRSISGVAVQATVRGPSKVVRLMTSVLATWGPCRVPRGAKKRVPGV